MSVCQLNSTFCGGQNSFFQVDEVKAVKCIANITCVCVSQENRSVSHH